MDKLVTKLYLNSVLEVHLHGQVIITLDKLKIFRQTADTPNGNVTG